MKSFRISLSFSSRLIFLYPNPLGISASSAFSGSLADAIASLKPLAGGLNRLVFFTYSGRAL